MLWVQRPRTTQTLKSNGMLSKDKNPPGCHIFTIRDFAFQNLYIITCTLYGLKSSGAAFRAYLAEHLDKNLRF